MHVSSEALSAFQQCKLNALLNDLTPSERHVLQQYCLDATDRFTYTWGDKAIADGVGKTPRALSMTKRKLIMKGYIKVIERETARDKNQRLLINFPRSNNDGRNLPLLRAERTKKVVVTVEDKRLNGGSSTSEGRKETSIYKENKELKEKVSLQRLHQQMTQEAGVIGVDFNIKVEASLRKLEEILSEEEIIRWARGQQGAIPGQYVGRLGDHARQTQEMAKRRESLRPKCDDPECDEKRMLTQIRDGKEVAVRCSVCHPNF